MATYFDPWFSLLISLFLLLRFFPIPSLIMQSTRNMRTAADFPFLLDVTTLTYLSYRCKEALHSAGEAMKPFIERWESNQFLICFKQQEPLCVTCFNAKFALVHYILQVSFVCCLIKYPEIVLSKCIRLFFPVFMKWIAVRECQNIHLTANLPCLLTNLNSTYLSCAITKVHIKPFYNQCLICYKHYSEVLMGCSSLNPPTVDTCTVAPHNIKK